MRKPRSNPGGRFDEPDPFFTPTHLRGPAPMLSVHRGDSALSMGACLRSHDIRNFHSAVQARG